MRRIFLSLLVLVSLGEMALLAQQYSGIGVSVFPGLSHRRLVSFDINNQTFVDSLEANEVAVPAYGAGVYLSYRGEKAGVQVGLNYSQTGYRGSRVSIPFDDPNVINFNESQFTFRAHAIEVPFALNFYQTLDRKNDFFFMLGSGISYNMRNDYIVTLYNAEQGQREVTPQARGDFRRINYSFQTSMGWEHRLTDKMVFSLAPTFRMWMAGVKRDVLLNRNLYQFGLRATVRWDREIEIVEY